MYGFVLYLSRSVVIKNHNPRKGTETAPTPNLNPIVVGIKNHNPRKGTETRDKPILHLFLFLALRITIPVRGRKLLSIGCSIGSDVASN